MIRTVNGNVLQTSQETEIAKFIQDLTGKYGITNALEATITTGRTPATTPQILQMRIKCDNLTDALFSNWFTTMSELDIVGDHYFLTHGGLYFRTPESIKGAIDAKKGLINGAGRLSPEQSKALAEGKADTRIITYEQFIEETKNGKNIKEPYTIKAERSKLAKLPNAYVLLAQWAEDPRAIMYSGGKARAQVYAEKLASLRIEKPWISIDNAKGEDRSRLLFVDNRNDIYDIYGVSGDYNLNDSGRFVGVAPEALVEKNLEDRVVELSGGRISFKGKIYKQE